ncbi:DNA polymerase III subunit gamma and tau [Nakamurella sp. GG22]
MALALYRKYRPATFSEVVGQEHVTEPLRTALAAGRINHAYLFSGPRGCGKTSSARILARSLNCVQGPTPDPCGVCPSCIALAPEGPGSLDVVELDAASHGGVDDTRDLRDKAFYMPSESRYRVFIIDEAHMVTTQGFNALLKIVEEPPEHLVFIFATTEPDKVLTTIRSRTHHYPFRLIPPTTLRALLERLCAEEGAIVEPAVLPLVIRAGGGSARDSLSVLDQLLAGAGPEGVTYRSAVALLGVTDAALIDEVVDALAAGDGASVFGAVDRVVEAGHDPRRFAADLLERLRDLVILNAVPGAVGKGLIDSPEDELAAMVGQADRLGIATLTRMAEVLHTGLVDMRGTTSPRLVLELLCARMLLPGSASGDPSLLQRLERMERRMDIAGDLGGAKVLGGVASEASVPAADVAASQASIRPVAPARSVGESRPPGGPASRPPVGASNGPPATNGAPQVDSVPTTGPNVNDRPEAPAARPSAGRKPATGPDLGLPKPPTLSSARREPARASNGDERTAPDQRNRATGEAPKAPDGAPPTHAAATEAAPAPAAPDTPVVTDTPIAASNIGVTDVRRVWPEVLVAVKRQRRTTQAILEAATVIGVENGQLQIAMPSAVMARRVLEPNNSDILRAALKEILGVNWTIRCEAAGATAEPASGPPRGSTGGPPSAGMASTGAGDPLPPPPPEDDIPDDYGEPVDPKAVADVRDPEQTAIALLSEQLGARPLEQQG